MNSYPNFIPPTSGYINYNFNTTNHLGLYDHMTWDLSKDKIPQSQYHPYYIHSINDSIYTQRQHANAASIELGIGKHIATIAKYANSYNLGNSINRIGVSYFKNINASGYCFINEGLAVENLNLSFINIISGVINSNSTFNIIPDNLKLYLTDTQADKIQSVDNTWSFDNGNITLTSSINLFDGNFTLNNLVGNITGNVIFNSFLSSVNVNCSASGFFETYLNKGISEYNRINYDTSNGHSHDARNWSKPEPINTIILGQVLYDEGVFYAIGSSQLISLSNNSTDENWAIIDTYNKSYYDEFSTLYKKDNYYDISESDKIGYLGSTEVIGIVGEDKLTINKTDEYKLQIKIKKTDKIFIIKNKLYFIQSENNRIYVHVYNSKKWDIYTSNIIGNIFNICLYKSELFIITTNQNIIGITRFTLFNNFKTIAVIRNITNFKDVVIYDHIVYVLFNNNVVAYNINNTDINQEILKIEDNTHTNKLSVYSNINYIFVQTGFIRTKILKDKSNALTLDAINGILSSDYNITLNNNIYSKSTIEALTKQSLYRDLIDITVDDYTLNPGKTEYINRYLYNKTGIRSLTYNDMTCATLFNNSYYFGHRGDISIFNKNNGSFNEPITTKIDGKICVKFLTLSDSIYALVQDFTDSEKDYLDILPAEGPYASKEEQVIPTVIPTEWSVPFTKLYYKDSESNNWYEAKQFTSQFGRRLIDAISHDNNIYIITHDINGSGVNSYKIEPNKLSQVPLVFSGVLNLNEALSLTTNILEYYPNTDGSYTISEEYLKQQETSVVYNDINNPTVIGELSVYQNGYPVRTSSNINGHHEFYLYNHPKGPYVIHDQVEVLYDNIPPSSIIPTQRGDPSTSSNPHSNAWMIGYIVRNNGQRYSYRTLSLTFLEEELPRPYRKSNRRDSEIQTEPKDINNPTIKIPIDKDHPEALTDSIISDKYAMKQRFDDVNNNRESIHFITSITYNKSIYLLVQVKTKLRIYKLTDFTDYIIQTPFEQSEHQPNPKQKLVFGDGLSYAGLKTGLNYIRDDYPFFIDFIPCELNNTLYSEIDIPSVIGNNYNTRFYTYSNIYILGDGDDLFIRKSESKDYRKNKRYATQSNFSIGGNLYLPLTFRMNHPTGELFSFVLGFFNDGSVGFLRNDNMINIIKNPMGRVQCIVKDGKYVISGIGMDDGEKITISYDDIKNDPIYGELSILVPQSISNIYNSFANKKWVIGEYDIKIEDNLNVRENY